MGLFRRKSKVTVESHVIDAGGMEGLGEEIMETLEEHGIHAGQSQVIDASSVPGLTEEIMEKLNESGVWEQAFSAMGEVAEAAASEDKVDQLSKLADLHESGALSDYEFAVAKQKLLDERWH